MSEHPLLEALIERDRRKMQELLYPNFAETWIDHEGGQVCAEGKNGKRAARAYDSEWVKREEDTPGSLAREFDTLLRELHEAVA